MKMNLSFPPSFPSNVANQRHELTRESTSAETQVVFTLNCTNLKNAGETDGNKKLHSISEVKFSRSSTPFDKDPYFPKLFYNMAAKISSKIAHPHPLQQPPSSLLFPLKKAL
ncbi:hypothetical protein [Ligilactobacillus ruminis]|uniref:hypothetical protein n=1 Tax=Ligilactobacillus ruminis TaxID=1623 RepID=UPI003CFC9BD1|nr:hypothetical protein [Ligilactobacillus ruminis]